jgi:hypothetical protein
MSDDKKPPSAEAPKPAQKAGPELKSPLDWAMATGNGPKESRSSDWTGTAVTMGMSGLKGSVEHEVASVLHGWRQHEEAENGPILLTREDYLTALKATHPEDEYDLDDKGEPKRDRWGNPVIKKHAGNPAPHAPALSKHKGAGVRVSLVNGKLTEAKA